jgi:hypothetical protein
MFATLLMLYRNYEKQTGLNTQGRLHQQPKKGPVNRLTRDILNEFYCIFISKKVDQYVNVF